jgi:putative membrane protein
VGKLMTTWIKGAVAGTLATAPMSLVMLLWQRRLPWHERYALPPRQLTRRVTQSVAKSLAVPEPSSSQQQALTVLGHFGYGAATGALYPAATSRLPAPPIVKGALFGLAVWLCSYLGWIPASGLMSSARHHPARRNALMIGAHLVWGAMLGVLEARSQE